MEMEVTQSMPVKVGKEVGALVLSRKIVTLVDNTANNARGLVVLPPGEEWLVMGTTAAAGVARIGAAYPQRDRD